MVIFTEVSENEFVRQRNPLSKAIIGLILCVVWQTCTVS